MEICNSAIQQQQSNNSSTDDTDEVTIGGGRMGPYYIFILTTCDLAFYQLYFQ